MNLSEKNLTKNETFSDVDDLYWGKDVKKFIKELKERLDLVSGRINCEQILNEIDKLSGEKLI